jgi:hypothetical protein
MRLRKKRNLIEDRHRWAAILKRKLYEGCYPIKPAAGDERRPTQRALSKVTRANIALACEVLSISAIVV